MALSDGTLKWCRPLGRLLGILGESSGRLYVRTENGLAILDTGSGQLLAEIEHHDVDEWLRVHNPDGLVALQVREDAQKPQVTLQMTFYNIPDGRCLGYSRIPLPEKKAPWIGPIVRWDTELLLFMGHPSSPARRTSYQIGVVSDGG
ncbi:MAG: hypothetical protein H5U01_06260 [Clostridia bacterium]|nr:hypothetical protein [Clostridia bacterium]